MKEAKGLPPVLLLSVFLFQHRCQPTLIMSRTHEEGTHRLCVQVHVMDIRKHKQNKNVANMSMKGFVK